MRGEVGIGKYHDIEVEDDVTCYMEYPNGASGVFITSTGETLRANGLKILSDGMIHSSQATLFKSNTAPWSDAHRATLDALEDRLGL